MRKPSCLTVWPLCQPPRKIGVMVSELVVLLLPLSVRNLTLLSLANFVYLYYEMSRNLKAGS